MPKRIQRKRTAGWRLPPNARCCDRSTRFGNPFTVEKHGRESAVRLFRDWLERRRRPTAEAPTYMRDDILARLPELRGKDLACYCLPEQACHCDVLLEMANR